MAITIRDGSSENVAPGIVAKFIPLTTDTQIGLRQVIHVLTHLPFTGALFSRFLRDGWQARTAREIAKRSHYVVESWLPAQIQRKYEEEDDGVSLKAFPAHGTPFTFSTGLLGELRKRVKDDNCIIHIHGERSTLAYMILALCKNVIVQHHWSGGLSVLSPVEALTLRKASNIYVLSRAKERYMRSIGLDGKKVKFQTMGVDLEKFRPLGRHSSRREINLPTGPFIVLYVGGFGPHKGLHIIIKALRELKRRFDVELLAVGGSKRDSMYNLVKSETPYVFLRTDTPNELLPTIYSAADLTCYYCSPVIERYAGPTVVVMESLACDTPVASNTLADLPNPSEAGKAGIFLRSPDKMARAIERVIEGGNRFDCRDMATRYFSWDKIAKRTLEDYAQIC